MQKLKTVAKSVTYGAFRFLNLPGMIINSVQMGVSCHLRGCIYIRNLGKKGSIHIGNHVNINSSMKADPIGGQTKTILYVLGNGSIKIGDGVGLSNTAIVSESAVTIGEYTNIGGGTKIYDTDFHSIRPDERLNGDTNVKSAQITIGKGVFIGGHCIILKGVTIGDGAVIGAGSVVTKDIPAGEIWAGNPAKCVGKVN